MKARNLANKILKTRVVTDEADNNFHLHSSIDKKESDFLETVLTKYKPLSCIEIGCAYGVSSLMICSILEKFKNPHHTIIDPHQSTTWNNIGILNLKRANIDFFELIELPSEIALPQLLSANKTYDFGFIDGYHSFDQTMLEFYYLNKLINVGGIIVIDDIGWPSINKFMRYVLNNYTNYEMINQVEFNYRLNRAFFEKVVKTPLSYTTKLFPKRIRNEIFSNKTINQDHKLKLNSTMVALQKTNDDNRSEESFADF